MKSKEFHSQRLLDALDQMDENLLLSAHSVDSPEAFRALDSAKPTKARFSRPFSNTRRLVAAAVCLAIALAIALSVFFLGDSRDPQSATQPPVPPATDTAPTDPTTETPRVVASGALGENLTWTFDENGLLTISGQGAMTEPERLPPWSGYRVRHLLVNEGVTQVCQRLFSGSSYLESVILPDSVTEIASDAFRDCTALTQVRLPGKLSQINRSTFCGCEKLETVNFPQGLELIDAYAFFGCKELKQVVLPKGLQTIGEYAFSECTALEEIDLPRGLRQIGSCAFAGCKNLLSIDIPFGVQVIEENTFSNCIQLQRVRLSYGVAVIRKSAFSGCTNLQSIYLPGTLQGIDTGAFSGCSSLEHVYFQGTRRHWKRMIIVNQEYVDPFTHQLTSTNAELMDARLHKYCSFYTCIGITEQVCLRCHTHSLALRMLLSAVLWVCLQERRRFGRNRYWHVSKSRAKGDIWDQPNPLE